MGLEDKVAKFEAEAAERKAAEKARREEGVAQVAAKEARRAKDQIAIQALGVDFAQLATERSIASRPLRESNPPVEGWVLKMPNYRMIMVTLAGEVNGYTLMRPSNEESTAELPNDLTAYQVEDIMAQALADPSRIH